VSAIHIRSTEELNKCPMEVRPFSPTIWERPHSDHNREASNSSSRADSGIEVSTRNNSWPLRMKQTWFRGVHSDIGGGSYPNQMNANLTFAWMISQLKADNLLEFDDTAFWDQIELSARGQLIAAKDPRAPVKDVLPKRKIFDGGCNKSMSVLYAVTTGFTQRGPRIYREAGSKWYQKYCWKFLYKLFGGIDPPLLQNTHEAVHYSVHSRGDGGGAGMAPWVFDDRKEDGGRTRGEWVSRKDDRIRVVEDDVGELEKELEKRWPDILDKVTKTYDERRTAS